MDSDDELSCFGENMQSLVDGFRANGFRAIIYRLRWKTYGL